MPDNNLEKSKEDLLAEIDRRIEDKIIEKTNADLLKKLINNADTLTEAVAIAELGTTYRRTGLHFDKRLEKFTDTIKYFKKNEDLSFKTDEKGLTHKLIIGDNYDALLNLLIEYRGRIDVIYIDPPYGKDSMGEFTEANYDNAITRDNLLSMLYPRLELAKQLLSEDGVIFCSIDDKNYAYIKCLFDEVFEERNFIGNIDWESKTKSQNTETAYQKLQPKCEYILCYGSDGIKHKFNLVSTGAKDYNMTDESGPYREHVLETMNANDVRGRKTMIFDIKDDNSTVTLPKGKQWKLGKDQIAYYKDRGDLFIRDNKVIIKMRPSDERNVKTLPFWAFFDKSIGTAESAKSKLNEILNRDHGFETVKPIELMSRLVFHASRPDSIVLDFFAGSGMTAHGVLALNKSEEKKNGKKGNRQFILCQINEVTEMQPNGIAYDVTAKHLKRIMTGECYDGNKNFDWIKNNEPYGDNLDVYEIKTVANFESSDGKTPFDVIDETLYSKEKMSPKDKIKWVCENFDNTQKYIEKDSDYKKRIEGAE